MFKPTTKLLSVATAALLMTTGIAHAQTQAVTATVTVQNNLTLAAPGNLNWGTIVAVGDAVQSASLAVSGLGVLGAPATTGAPAVIAIVDNTAAEGAQITIDGGADGATLNVDFQNVVDPTDGVSSFTLDTFLVDRNAAGAPAAQVAGVPFTFVYDAAFNAGVNTMDIGATITTASTIFADAVYAGGFDAVFSY